MSSTPDVNPFMQLTEEELAAECMIKAGAILKREQRTKAGDEIALLLIACAHTLNPPATPEEGFSDRG